MKLVLIVLLTFLISVLASVGYYVGDVMALYGYTYGFGLCISSTLFYSGAYGMKLIRKTDDAINHATSGALCAGLLVSHCAICVSKSRHRCHEIT